MSDNKLVEGLGDVNLNDKQETEVPFIFYACFLFSVFSFQFTIINYRQKRLKDLLLIRMVGTPRKGTHLIIREKRIRTH